MITLTESAAREISRLHSEGAEEGQLLRIYVKSGGCSGLEYAMGFDAPGEEDQVFESSGVKIVIDPKSHAKLDGAEVDFDDGLNGKGFEIHNPNATSTCGCGKSFQ